MNEDPIGVLWKNSKTNINGKKIYWYSGNLTCPECKCETKIVEFHNLEKKTDNSPDKNILVRQAQPREETPAKQTNTDTKRKSTSNSDLEKEFEDTFDDDIPF